MGLFLLSSFAVAHSCEHSQNSSGVTQVFTYLGTEGFILQSIFTRYDEFFFQYGRTLSEGDITDNMPR